MAKTKMVRFENRAGDPDNPFGFVYWGDDKRAVYTTDNLQKEIILKPYATGGWDERDAKNLSEVAAELSDFFKKPVKIDFASTKK